MTKRSILRRLALLLAALLLCAGVAAAAGEETDNAIEPQAAVSTLKLTAADGVTVQLFDADGAEIAPSAQSGNTYTFRSLTPGAEYTYVATKDVYYHASEKLKAPESGSTSLNVQEPKTDENWLTELALGPDSGKKDGIALNTAFSAGVHSYTAQVPDSPSAVCLWVNGNANLTSFSAPYRQISSAESTDDQMKVQPIEKNELGKGKNLPLLLMNRNGRGNTLTVRCTRTEGTAQYWQDYVIELTRTLSLAGVELRLDGETLPLVQAGTETVGFKPAVREYTLNVPAAAAELTLCASAYSSKGSWRDGKQNGYHVWLGETELTSGAETKIALEDSQQTIELRVTNDYAGQTEGIYRITVQKSAPVTLQAAATPADALLFVADTRSGSRILPDAAGNYALTAGNSYTYMLTAPGYAGQSGTIEAETDAQGAMVLRVGETRVPVTDGKAQIELSLTKAAESGLKTLPSQWADFRGSAYDAQGVLTGSGNNSVRSEKTPVRAEDSTLYWAQKLGDGYSSGAVSCPILVDGDLVVYSGSKLYRVDTVSGEVVKEGTMERGSAHATVPPTYAGGMILIPLSDGTVQAFDAATLESLWVYHDPLIGQPVCPITVCGDYLYVGFWNNEDVAANFVCLTLTDEDPTRTDEEKTASWYRTQLGGFYWAGAYACEDYVLVGTDDGAEGSTSMSGNLLLLDAKTGEELDVWTGLRGDVRSTICFDGSAFYFTTKGGWFCGVQTEKTADGWRLKEESKWTLALDNGTQTAPMSTSTPVVYNGRAYVGVCGSSQFVNYSGHKIAVIDLKQHTLAYSVETVGYVQTSGVLTTAYEQETGIVYVYFFENTNPGSLRVLEDKPGQTKPSYVTEQNGTDMAYVLFTPSQAQAQYCICSPIVDENGVMYFKNDSGYLMAFGPSVQLEITKSPDKTTYAAGERFDPKGMKAELVYANGTRRDVTDAVQYTTEPLTAEDAAFTVRFPYVLYHDQETGGVHETNVTTTTPSAQLTLTISGDAPQTFYGDVNGDGKIDVSDVTLLQRRIAQLLTQEETFLAQNADVNGDGKIDVSDVTLLQQRIAQLISRFPVESK